MTAIMQPQPHPELNEADESIIVETVQILEDLVQAIKDRNLNRFDDLTYDTEGVYCSGQGLAVIADLESTRIIIEEETNVQI